MKFPDYYPDNCPDPKSSSRQLVVYRFVEEGEIGEQPLEEYFRPISVMNPAKRFKGKKLCESCGLSVHSSLDGIREAKRVYPRFKTSKIAKGDITPESGKILETPSNVSKTHLTWWVPDGIIACSYFKIVE